MYAVEFEVDTQEDIIKIPKQYKELFSKHVRIIAMINEENRQASLDTSESVESLDLMKMQESSSFYKDVIGSPNEDVWDNLKPYPNISQEI